MTKRKHRDPDATTTVPSKGGPSYAIERHGKLIHLVRTMPHYQARIVMDRADVINVCNALVDATESHAA